jgi:hypothetical protein
VSERYQENISGLNVVQIKKFIGFGEVGYVHLSEEESRSLIHSYENIKYYLDERRLILQPILKNKGVRPCS